MSAATDALIAALRERGLATKDAPMRAADDVERPWFLSLLLGIAGWAAGAFVLAFLFTFLDLTSTRPLLRIGLVLLGIAWLLYAVSRRLVFVDQLALALSIAGQISLALFLGDALDRTLHVAAALLCLQLVVFVAMPDRTAKILAAFLAGVAWVFVVRFWMQPDAGAGPFMDSHGQVVAPLLGAWTLPAEWLLMWAPPILALLWLRHTETRWMAHRAASFARPAITGLLLALAVGGIGAEPESLLVVGPDDLGHPFTAWALVPLGSIALAMFAAWLAFSLRSAGMLGLCIVAALAHLARFYYLYGTTLTLKAGIMLALGLVLLGAGRLLGRHAGDAP
jgi:hypothetical protein